MIPFQQTITVYRGDTYSQTIRLRMRTWNPLLNNGQGDWAPGAYRDLTGWTGLFQIRTQPDDPQAAGVGTVTIGDQTNPNTLGQVVYSMPGSITQTLVPDPAYVPRYHQDWLGGGWMYYDLQLNDPAGNARTYLAGLVKLVKDISQ